MKTLYKLEKITQQELKINDVYQGCTIDTDYNAEEIETYEVLEHALVALGFYRTDAHVCADGKTWSVTEYAVEEYEADEDGEFVSGSNFYFSEFSKESLERLNNVKVEY